MKAAILYSGKFGSTGQYARWISKATGFPIFNLRREKPDLQQYEALILGTSIFAAKPIIAPWIRTHWSLLRKKKLILFTVSGTRPGHPDLMRWLRTHIGKEMLDTMDYIGLPGRMCISDLPWHIRFKLKLAARAEEDPAAQKRMIKGFDYMNRKALNPILQWCNDLFCTPAQPSIPDQKEVQIGALA